MDKKDTGGAPELGKTKDFDIELYEETRKNSISNHIRSFILAVV